ncbi:MAG: type II secretion system protein J [Phycisphaerales bacterium]
MSCSTRPVLPLRGAFTLVETVAAIVIIATIGTISSSIIYTGINGYRDASASSRLHSEASAAFERIATLLRSVPRSASAGTTAPAITSVTATSIVFDTDWTLSLSGTDLLLAEDGGTARTLLPNVTGLAIQCYDQSNSALSATLAGADCYSIRRIQLSLTVSNEGVTHTVRTRVFVRSTMSGVKVG